MGKKSITSCRTDRDFIRYARRAGADAVNGSKHQAVIYKGEKWPLPHGELKPGVRHATVKWFIRMGLVGSLIGGLAFWLVRGV